MPRYTSDPWERPLRFVSQDKLKKLGAQEKEARLLVACWQGREDEVKKIFSSGKPQPRVDNSQQIKEEREYRARGKAHRAATKISEVKFAKADLYRYGTPLHKACQKGDTTVVEILLENISAPAQLVDEKTEVGNTPLHCAAHMGHAHICELLLECLADVQVSVHPKTFQRLESGDLNWNASLAAIMSRNRFLSTPLDKAREANHRAAAKVIEEWPQRLERRNELTKQLAKFLDDYSRDIAKLAKDTSGLRKLIREAEALGCPRIKESLLADVKAMLQKAEH